MISIGCTDEVETGASDAGAHRSNRAAEHLSSFGVLQTQHLGEDKSRSSVIIEALDERLERESPRVIGRDHGSEAATGECVVDGAGITSTAPLLAASVVDAHPPGDRQEPGFRRPVVAVAMQRPNRALVGLLCQVVSVAEVTEVPTHSPDVSLGLDDELFEGALIALLCLEKQMGESVHNDIVSSQGTKHPGLSTCLTWNRPIRPPIRPP